MENSKQRIAQRLKIAREMSGLSQSQVAVKINLQRPAISEIESGKRNVSAEELLIFSKLYGINLSWLLGEDQTKTSQVTDRVELVAREISKLRKEDFDQLIQLLQAIRKDQ